MSYFDKLDDFSLVVHGDRHEKTWWPLLVNFFPSYEVFWRRYICPLTNRVDSSILNNDPHWIRMRKDLNELTREKYERLAMRHYSVFYFFARASGGVYSPQSVFPEDVFYLLDSCGENVKEFLQLLVPIVKDLGCSTDFLEKEPKHECDAFNEVIEYRNVLLHGTVLGRAVGVNAEFLPKREFLKQVEESWDEAEKLTMEQRIHSRMLMSRLHREIAAYLEKKWQDIIEAMGEESTKEKFSNNVGLTGYLPNLEINQDMALEIFIPTTAVPSASGASIGRTVGPREPTLSSNTSSEKREGILPPVDDEEE